jgi:hypothetical protein
MPGAITFDFLENFIDGRFEIRVWLWPIVVAASFVEWWLVWTCCTLAESFGDTSLREDWASACVRGDACVQQTTVLDGSLSPTPSPLRALSFGAASDEQLTLLHVSLDVRWNLDSLLLCSMRFAALSGYCILAFIATVLLLMVWHPRCLAAVLAVSAATVFLCCEQ